MKFKAIAVTSVLLSISPFVAHADCLQHYQTEIAKTQQQIASGKGPYKGDVKAHLQSMQVAQELIIEANRGTAGGDITKIYEDFDEATASTTYLSVDMLIQTIQVGNTSDIFCNQSLATPQDMLRTAVSLIGSGDASMAESEKLAYPGTGIDEGGATSDNYTYGGFFPVTPAQKAADVATGVAATTGAVAVGVGVIKGAATLIANHRETVAQARAASFEEAEGGTLNSDGFITIDALGSTVATTTGALYIGSKMYQAKKDNKSTVEAGVCASADLATAIGAGVATGGLGFVASAAAGGAVLGGGLGVCTVGKKVVKDIVNGALAVSPAMQKNTAFQNGILGSQNQPDPQQQARRDATVRECQEMYPDNSNCGYYSNHEVDTSSPVASGAQ